MRWLTFWKRVIISSIGAQSPWRAYIKISIRFAPAEKCAEPFPMTRPFQSPFSTSSAVFSIISMISLSMEFILVWNSSSATRSEEHTSELQSRPHLVCRLLLEKKNSITQTWGMRLLIESHSTRADAAGDDTDAEPLQQMFRAHSRAVEVLEEDPRPYVHYLARA